MTLADIQGIKTEFNYTCYQYTAVGKYCTLCVQMLDGANWHEAPWKPGLLTFTIVKWTLHSACFTSKSMISIYIFWARLMPLKKNKSYLNDIIWIMLHFGLQKACWSYQVERGNNVLPDPTSVERQNLIGLYFLSKEISLATSESTRLNESVFSESTEPLDNVQLTICTSVLWWDLMYTEGVHSHTMLNEASYCPLNANKCFCSQHAISCYI